MTADFDPDVQLTNHRGGVFVDRRLVVQCTHRTVQLSVPCTLHTYMTFKYLHIQKLYGRVLTCDPSAVHLLRLYCYESADDDGGGLLWMVCVFRGQEERAEPI